MKEKKFTPEVCECCTQAKTYRLGLDKGSAKIVLAIIDAVVRKGINEIHPAREMDTSGNKKWYLTNLSRPRFHGLIAYIDDKKGYYCVTRKAGKFLRGMAIPKYAIISKVTGHQEGYWNADDEQVTIGELLKSPIQWEGDYNKMLDTIDPTEQAAATLF